MIKDMIYLKGFASILEYLRNNGSLDLLFVGKIGVDHIPFIQELLDRKVLKQAPLHAKYLSLPHVKQRLTLLHKGAGVLELIKGSQS